MSGAKVVSPLDIYEQRNLSLLIHHTAKPVCWHWVVVEGKYSIYCRAPSKENGQLVLKRPELSGKGFKGNTWGEGCSSCIFLQLVGCEVAGWCFRNLNHQPSGCNQLESTWKGKKIQKDLKIEKELKSEKERGTEKERIRERSKIEKGRKEVRERDTETKRGRREEKVREKEGKGKETKEREG